MKYLILLSFMALSSCSFIQGLDFKGSVAYIADDGAKARIVSDGRETSIEGWKRVGDSWVRVGTTITPDVEAEK